jgi:lysophospholipase L1-like esterase
MVILFQGDSITDCGRSRTDDADVGRGYPLMVKAELGYREAGAHTFYNRGISGNRIVDVYARIKADIINLKPDVMSILIGINDVWHEVSYQNGVDADKFYTIYTMLIKEIKAALPNIKIMILEPFVLPATATEENWQTFRTECDKRAEVAKRIAEEQGLAFIPLQAELDARLKDAPAEYWLRDGVHPTAFGHRLITEKWLEAYKSL